MPKPVTLEGFGQGLNTLLQSDALPPDALRRAVNIDIDDIGKIGVRQGAARVYSGSIQHSSLWSGPKRTFFVESGHLKELVIRADGTFAALLVRLNVGAYKMAYLNLNGQTYYTNGLINGIITEDGIDKPWGIPSPQMQPAAAAVGGGELAAGTYQVAITFLDAAGQESGTGLARVVEVAEGGAIALSNFPGVPSGVTHVRIYVSHCNGEGLYKLIDAPASIAVHKITRVSNLATIRLETQFGSTPPPGQLLEELNGRIYIAQGRVLWMTEPLRYGLVKRRRGYIMFPEDITVLKAVSDGLFVASDETYFLTGMDTPALQQRSVLPYGAVFDTGIQLPQYDAVAWFSTNGIVFGARAGEVLNIMEDRVAVSSYRSGSMAFREHDGLRQLVANLWDAGDRTRFFAPDYVELEASRTGADYL